MKRDEEIKALLTFIQETHAPVIQYDEKRIQSDFQKNDNKLSFPLKLLSIIGGYLATSLFVGFIVAFQILYQSDIALMVFGGFFILASIWILRLSNIIFLETVCVCTFLIGCVMLGYGYINAELGVNQVSILFLLIAIASIIISKHYILSFLGLLIIYGSILTLILYNELFTGVLIYTSVLGLMLYFYLTNEAKIIKRFKIFTYIYNPIRTGLILSFVSNLAILCLRGMLDIPVDYVWISSLINISLITIFLLKIYKTLQVTEMKSKIFLSIFSLLILLPTVTFPGISGAILIILLCFFVKYKTGFVLGVLAFLYFVSQFYYDLNLTLLNKSILLFLSGILFLTLYYFTNKTLAKHEKI
jgi:hypothetical protein